MPRSAPAHRPPVQPPPPPLSHSPGPASRGSRRPGLLHPPPPPRPQAGTPPPDGAGAGLGEGEARPPDGDSGGHGSRRGADRLTAESRCPPQPCPCAGQRRAGLGAPRGREGAAHACPGDRAADTAPEAGTGCVLAHRQAAVKGSRCVWEKPLEAGASVAAPCWHTQDFP
ncbi:basic proline-rich protein-like isoform X2 [Colius striatus]|uniref:basic proline-rich protein-like isoform X2 n=1 Tax=Colius striatus TaxID=57412 RepID=UPI002B1DB2E1|nr:basic proline-rich protein-like isoform X2 [Colius striatus]